MKHPDDGHRADSAAENKSGISVLLVDDSSTIRRSARGFLESEGYTVFTAKDGIEALSRVVEHRPSIVFVDFMMSRLDGYQICTLIQNNTDFQDIVLIMLADDESLFDPDRARAVGCVAHLSKPLTAQSLAEAVRLYTGTTATGTPVAGLKSKEAVQPTETSDA